MGFPCATKSSSMWRGSQSTGCLRCRLEMLTLGVFCFGPVRYTFRPAHLQYSRLSQVDHILLQSILQRATTSPLRKLRELALFCHRKSRGSTRFAFQAAEQPKVIWNLRKAQTESPRNMWQTYDSISSYHDGQPVTTNSTKSTDLPTMIRHLLLAQRPEMLFRILLLLGRRWMRHDGARFCHGLPKLQSLSIAQYSCHLMASHVRLFYDELQFDISCFKGKWVSCFKMHKAKAHGWTIAVPSPLAHGISCSILFSFHSFGMPECHPTSFIIITDHTTAFGLFRPESSAMFWGLSQADATVAARHV